MADYRRALLEALRENGCTFVRQANGSHELWRSPHSNALFVVQRDLRSRTAANAAPIVRNEEAVAKSHRLYGANGS